MNNNWCDVIGHAPGVDVIYIPVGMRGSSKSEGVTQLSANKWIAAAGELDKWAVKLPVLGKRDIIWPMCIIKGNTWREAALPGANMELLRYPRCSHEMTTNLLKISKTITQEQRRMQTTEFGVWYNYYDLY